MKSEVTLWRFVWLSQSSAINLPNILARCTQGAHPVSKCLVTSFYEYQLLEVKKFEFHVDKTNLILKNLILNKTYSCSVVKVGKRVEYCTYIFFQRRCQVKKTEQNKIRIFFFKSLRRQVKLAFNYFITECYKFNIKEFIYQSISW